MAADIPRDPMATEDLIGMDRLARAVLRTAARLGPGRLVAVHGAPGSGKSEFLRRMAFLAQQGQGRLDGAPPARVAWYRPWAWSKQGNVLAGLVAAVARSGPNPALHLERAREVVGGVQRLRFDGGLVEAAGGALTGADADPVQALSRGFAALVEQVKGGRNARLLVFVDEADRLSPGQRWQLLDGARIALSGGADATVFVSIGRESARAAVRFRDGDVPDAAADRDLADLFDLTITVPSLEVRRIGSLLRRFVGSAEGVVRAAFGEEAIQGLSAAVAHRPLGSPRFLERLAARVVLLAEYAHEVRAARELTEAQWAWVIVGERWPEFRRFMIRGGRERWAELRVAVARLARRAERMAPAPDNTVAEWLRRDPILADYLSINAEGFARDTEAVFWIENLLLAAGL